MPAFFHNKIVKVIGIIFVVLLVVVIFLGIVLGSLNDARSGVSYERMNTPSVAYQKGSMADDGFYAAEIESDMMATSPSYYPPTPQHDGYVTNLEAYETTTYNASGKTKQFDEVCATVVNLKKEKDVEFQSLTTQTNRCYASFFVAEERASSVAETLKSFKGIEIVRNTSSVTRHRQQIQSRTSILKQQLARVEKTLTSAEAQLDRLNSRFHNTEEVTELSSEVTKSMQFIDQLTNKKISLNSQLDNAYQQAADLEARMDVIEFSVSLTRANPLYPNKFSSQWDNAWEEVKEQLNENLIGITAVFAIFLFWMIRLGLYALVLILIIRGLWKFAKLVWTKW